ncbi:hypothetical protein [Nostoc sp.]|uniref:hypothetical protein n=1 Tax=Nostoc sp. TaxID=1180 RepID=UPI002FFA50FA
MIKNIYIFSKTLIFPMLTEESVKIFHNFRDKYVEARVIPISSIHLQEIETIWKPQLQKEKWWDKNFNINKYLNLPETYEVYVLECDSVAQGIIVLQINKCPCRLELGKNLVYLNLLNVAPWNRVSLQGTRNYKGVGTVLLTFAILRSINLGFQGRIALNSLKSSESFYQKLPFVHVGSDLFFCGNNVNPLILKYLEMPESEVELILLNSYLTWYLN